MWIVFRLVIALLAFFARQLARAKKPPTQMTYDGRAHYERVHKNKRGITGFTVGAALDAKAVFTIERENARDRFFKGVGLSTEMETGDREFDELVYIMSDHPMVGGLLKRSAPAREAVRAALRDDFTRIHFDGHVVWADKRAPRTPTDDDHKIVGALAKAFAPMTTDPSGRLADPFLWRALVVEGVVWSFGGYALASFFGLLMQKEDVVLDHGALFMPGVITAAVVFAALLGLTVALLRGSSRGHRLILESALILVVALPFTGPQAFLDVNRALDRSRVTVEVPVSSCETRITTSRSRGRTRSSTSYILHASAGVREGIAIPAELRTNAELCRMVSAPTTATLVLGRGALGHAWIRQLRVPGKAWSS